MSLVISYNSTDEFVPQWQHYDVIKMLGRGASSMVWLAQDSLTQKEVAIKQLKPGAPVPHQEFSYLASLRHRGLPRAYEMFQEKGCWHLVMDPVHGDTLRIYRSVHGRVVPPEEVRDIGVQLAAVLDELHSHGILYRDLKPTNVIREPSGRIRLVDFGSATQGYDNDCYVTPPYASPEQRVQCESIDERSDIYSLGVVLYELLTGKSDFEMDPYQDEELERLRSVFLTMIAQDPEKRPQSMVDVILVLLRG
jgi:serine/threonine protein kinase